jgi:opacity protein-like surface antigen
MKIFTFASCLGLLFIVGTLSAQEVSRFTFDLGAGFTSPVGNTSNYLDEAWNLQGGVGYNFTSHIGAMLQLDYNSFGMSSVALNNAGYPGGDIHVFSATIDPIYHLNPKGRLDPYFIGGGGVYHWDEQLSAPAAGTAISPFNGGSFPLIEPSSGEQYSVNKPGFNAGAGVAFALHGHGKIFAEARYVHVFLNSNERADYVPATFGYRW